MTPNEDRIDEMIEIPIDFNDCIIHQGTNFFQLIWEFEHESFIGNEYFLSIEVSKRRTIDKVIRNAIDSSQEQYGQFIDKYFSESKDIDQVKVRISDPLTLVNIQYPCRGNYCEHINTFCLKNLLLNL